MVIELKISMRIRMVEQVARTVESMCVEFCLEKLNERECLKNTDMKEKKVLKLILKKYFKVMEYISGQNKNKNFLL
jgi:hypothetical protein